jgi:hypothetical protein
VLGGDVDGTVYPPQFTKDGLRVVYRADQQLDNFYGVFSAPVGVANANVELGAGRGSCQTFAIEQNLNRVVFVAGPTNGESLYSVPASGGASTGIAPAGVDPAWTPTFSPDDSTTIFRWRATPALPFDLYSGPLQGGGGARINGNLASGGSAGPALVTPDSKRVTYVASEQDPAFSSYFVKILAADPDGDGQLSYCDLLPYDGSAFAIPHEMRVIDESKPSPTVAAFTFRHGDGGTGTVHDIITGSVNSLPVGPGGSDETGTCSTSATVYTMNEIPPPGEAYWVLARGRNAAGVGTYGYQESGGHQVSERQSSTCP